MKFLGFNDAGRRCGETHHRAKFSDQEIDLVLYLRAEGLSFAAIAMKWDDDKTMSPSTARAICTGRIRAQHPATFRPAKRR